VRRIRLNEKWKKLIEGFKEEGYSPYDIQRIVKTYEVFMTYDEKLKKLYEEEKNEREHSNSLSSE
jgi:hypothetical protein